MEKSLLLYVPLAKIKIGKRIREDFGDMKGLVEIVKEKGILQPITINTRFELRAGERRYRAAKEAGLKEIPCLIRPDADTADSLEVELIENVFRKDFTPFERAAQIEKLHNHCVTKKLDWSKRKTAQLLGAVHSTVALDLQLAEAVRAFPELKQLKTADEAHRAIKKLHEGIVVEELRRRQEASTATGTAHLLKVAKANYMIGDTFAGMKTLHAGMAHFIELDPPYAIALNKQKGGASQRDRGTTGAGSLVQKYNEIPPEKYPAWMENMAKETFRVARRDSWMVCWFGMTHFHLVQGVLRKAGWSVNDIPALWVKPSGQTAAPEYNLASCYEPFFVCRKGQPALIKRGHANVFHHDHVPPAKKYHPTERPLSLMMEILEVFTLPSQICLVPCVGSGVTLRSCYLSGLKGFGWDISNEYLDKFLLAVEEDMRELDGQPEEEAA